MDESQDESAAIPVLPDGYDDAGTLESRPDRLAPPRAPLDRTDALALVVIVAATLLLYLVRLGSPGALLPSDAKQCVEHPPLAGARCHALIPLDEVHYVPDARDVIRYGTDSDVRVTEQNNPFVVHPPVGKWYIAAGIKLFGDRPFGWRFFGAVFGALSTALVYLIGRRFWSVRWPAILAAVLLAVDGLWFVQSRVAMLDIYGAAFLLLGVWLLIEDRDRLEPGIRWWRLGAGVAFGLALASKWSVGPLVAAALGMASAWEVTRARATDPRHTVRRALALLGALVLVPLATYVATYVPWALNDQRYAPGDCSSNSTIVSEWICYNDQIVHFHRTLAKYETVPPEKDAPPDAPTKRKAKHPYFGHAWTWPFIGRPVAHHFEDIGGTASEVMGLPNPTIWWPAFFVGLPALAWWTLRRRDPVAPVLFALIIAGWAPYLFADAIERPVFLFYALPIVPFLVLGVVHTLVRLTEGWPRAHRFAIGYAALAVVMFAYFYPLLAAHPIPRDGPLGWEAHLWFNGPLSDCRVPDIIKTRCWI